MHPALSLQTHYDTKPFMMIPDVGTECNTRRAKSVTAYRHIQAQRASVCHLASARYIFCCCCRFLFFPLPPKRSTLALGPGPETSENRRLVYSVLCSCCLVKALPLTSLLSKHTTVSLDSPAVFAPTLR